MYRTDYGLVQYTATIGGKPVAYTVQRSQYMHEAGSAIGFMLFNNPSVMSTAAGFETAASNVNFDFNWFYVNSAHTAYYNSGQNPVRADGTDPNLPLWGTAADEWVGWNPTTYTESGHPGLGAPELHRPGLLRVLEQQAGPRTTAPPTATSAGAPSNAWTCSTPGSRTSWRPARSSPRPR